MIRTARVLIGFGGLAVLVFLIAIRMPIAYAMILVGGVGTCAERSGCSS